MRWLNLLLNPWVVFAFAGAGIAVGLFYQQVAVYLKPLADVFIGLVEMCVIPIMITAVVSSLGHLINAGKTKVYLVYLILVMLTSMFIASMVGLGIAKTGQPGANLDDSAQVVLGRQISVSELSASDSKMDNTDFGFYAFIEQLIPNNLIQSIGEDERLAIIFFSILLGIALGTVNKTNNGVALKVMDAFYEAFIKIIDWIMYLLPFGLFALLASQIAIVGTDVLLATVKLVICIYLGALLLILLFSLYIWQVVGGSFWDYLRIKRKPWLIAFGTASSFAAIPAAIVSLTERLKLKKETVHLVFPLGVAINPTGTIFHFALSTLFIAQIYDVDLSFAQLAMVFVGAIITGIASAGAPGIVAISVIALILSPLNLPVAVAIVLLIMIDPIVDPILTVVNVQANCAVTVAMSKTQPETQPPPAKAEELI